MFEAIKQGFLAFIQDVVDSAIISQLTAAIEAGDFDKVFAMLGITPGRFRPFTMAVQQAFEQGAVDMAASFPRYVQTPYGKGTFRFNIDNERSQIWMRNKSSSLITNITEEARVVTRNSLEGAMLAGRNPRNTALDLVGRIDPVTKRRTGGTVGLTIQQEAWTAATRRQLETLDPAYFDKKLRDRRFDGIVQRAIADGKPLTKAQIDKLTNRYADRALKYRGDMIARTEQLTALSASEYEAVRQVVESGAAREKDVKRMWQTAGDDRVRHSHEEMDGQIRGLNEPYVTPRGARLMFPRDASLNAPASEIISCRCREKITVDWIGAALND